MRSPNTRHTGLHHIAIPELGYSPLSLSDPGFSSPAESDTVQTPLFDHSDHDIAFETDRSGQCEIAHRHILSHQDHEGKKRERAPCAPGSMSDPQLFPPMEGDPPLFSDKSPPNYELVMEMDPFSSAFSTEFYDPEMKIKTIPQPPMLGGTSNRVSQATHSIKYRPRIPNIFNVQARLHSPHFPVEHKLNPYFVRSYKLEDELGSGGYGFVMTAHHRLEGHEVAVKFIIKDKVPDNAWMEDEIIGRLPTEVMLLSLIDHENIVKCLDLFEDPLYFYLVQELHGCPWSKPETDYHRKALPTSTSHISVALSTPSLSPPASEASLADFEPRTPLCSPSHPHRHSHVLECGGNILQNHTTTHRESELPKPDLVATQIISRPEFSRRPSHDLFECIEQSQHKRLSEDQARYVFAQVVEVVSYLDSRGITHRDIKDENLVIDKDLKVKLIDFGSAIIVDPSEPRPYYTLFYGTSAYASSEILRKQSYQAPPAEIWTLGVLLSYLLTGASAFPTAKAAIEGNIGLTPGARVSPAAMDLMRVCLDPNPRTRATIDQIRTHQWLNGEHAQAPSSTGRPRC